VNKRLAKRRLLILGPTFRRNSSKKILTAIERYDGVFFRVARKHLERVHNVDIVIMIDDLTLVDGNSYLPYIPPEGERWGKQTFSKEMYKEARAKNEAFLSKKLSRGRYAEIYIAMGKKYAKALPDLSHLKVVFPTHGGFGPKAKALKEWISGERDDEV